MQIVLQRRNLFFLLPLLYLSIAWTLPALRGLASSPAGGYHNWTPDQFQRLMAASDSLSEAENAWFVTAGVCGRCHGMDTAGIAMVDPSGRDINFTDYWRATMMANSARDPFWRAQVSHEGIVDPGHRDLLEDECSTCHAPLGRYSHYFENPGQHYSIAQLQTDPLGLDGVSCMACHAMRGDSLGATFSGRIYLDTNRIAYGPFPGPYSGPMVDSIDILPAYGPHIEDSRLCAGCHTLITETIDLQGNFTGNKFVEQATYHEWLASEYASEGTSCQSCHVPQLSDPVIVSAHYPNILFGRSPYGLHEFAGANVFMLRLLRDNIDSLRIPATTAQFDSVIARTERMLQQQAVDMYLVLDSADADTAYYRLRLENKAGHKFPSGYPSRRAFVEFVLRDAMGDTLFASGLLGPDYEVQGQDPVYEPHYQMINDPGQAQIYEFIMGDVNGDPTTTLRRGASHLKDNRLPPVGLLSSHPVYDTVEIAGLALQDPDFNRDNGLEGSGADEVHYHVPLGGYAGPLQVSARFWYQTVRPGWLDETFASNSPAIARFQAMYDAADKSPVLVAELNGPFWTVGLAPARPLQASIWPNPSPEGWVFLELGDPMAVERIRVYDMQGRLLWDRATERQALYQVPLGTMAGIYWIEMSGPGGRLVRRVIRQ